MACSIICSFERLRCFPKGQYYIVHSQAQLSKLTGINAGIKRPLNHRRAPISLMKRSLDSLDDDERKPESRVELPEDFKDRHTTQFCQACNHILQVDPTLYEIITKQDFPLFLKGKQEQRTLGHHYAKLASAILSQQISGAAARSIKTKLMKNFDDEFPSHRQMHEQLGEPTGRETIRACGLSARKVTYLESLTEYFIKNEEEIEKLFSGEDNDDEIVEQLTKNVKGIGPWSAKMFLVTGLGRYDVFAVEDLGLARGCSNYLSNKPTLVAKLTDSRIAAKKSKIKHKKLNWKIYDDDLVEMCAERFAPYRTVLMFIFWRLASTSVEAMEKNETEFVNK